MSLALAEDLTPLGDLSAALIDGSAAASGTLVSRQDGVLAGSSCADETFAQVDDQIAVAWSRADGAPLAPGDVIAEVSGPLRSILTAERTALNFLCHLSGVATLTARFVAAAGEGCRVWDTRKTTPGLRALEKAAVRAGGGFNHRGNLSEWVMLKDNHVAHVELAEAVAHAHRRWPGRMVHVEVENRDQLDAALRAGCDAILLDNMSAEEVSGSVAAIDEWASTAGRTRPLVEASGGISLEKIAVYSRTGIDLISTSAITQSAPALDIGLDLD